VVTCVAFPVEPDSDELSASDRLIGRALPDSSFVRLWTGERMSGWEVESPRGRVIPPDEAAFDSWLLGSSVSCEPAPKASG
jgi:hypothetical protein